MSAMYVEMNSLIVLPSDDMRELTLERNYLSAMFVGNPSVDVVMLSDIKELTVGKNHMSAICMKAITQSFPLRQHERIPTG